MSDGGKGSRARPLSVDRKTFEDNWDRIFGNSRVRKEVQQIRDLKDTTTIEEKQERAWLRDEFQDILSTEDCMLSALEGFEELEKKHKK